VTGWNYGPHEPITLKFNGQRWNLGSTMSNGDGSWTAYVTIPSGTKYGGQTIVASGNRGDSAGTGFTVLNAPHGSPSHGGFWSWL
jgi:hypothetical protein